MWSTLRSVTVTLTYLRHVSWHWADYDFPTYRISENTMKYTEKHTNRIMNCCKTMLFSGCSWWHKATHPLPSQTKHSNITHSYITCHYFYHNGKFLLMLSPWIPAGVLWTLHIYVYIFCMGSIILPAWNKGWYIRSAGRYFQLCWLKLDTTVLHLVVLVALWFTVWQFKRQLAWNK